MNFEPCASGRVSLLSSNIGRRSGRIEIEDSDRGPKVTIQPTEPGPDGAPQEPIAYQLPNWGEFCVLTSG